MLDASAAIDRVMHLMAIPGVSCREGKVAEFLQNELRAAGVPATAIAFDTAHRKTPVPGEVGNLICKLPGTVRGPRRLMMAHMDTVPICLGSRPVRQGNLARSADPRTGLGADDRAGCAVVLTAALEVLERKLPHPPLTLLWTVQEEIGLHGARLVNQAKLGKPKLAFNWDGGSCEKLTIGATGGYRFDIEIEGLASHAGGAPEQGISAIAIAALAIADLHRGGWHGGIRRGKHYGTSNVGVIEGGAATNVVTDRVRVRAEARSHDPKFRARIIREIEQAFKRAVREVKNEAGARGEVKIAGRLDYESFRLADDEPCLLEAEEAVRAVGRNPLRAISNGGVDANWMTLHGIPTITLGCGQRNQHMVTEALDIEEYLDACRIGLRLVSPETPIP